MNLAELRKKAQKDRKEEVVFTPPVPEFCAQVEEALTQLPVEALLDEDLADPFVMEEQADLGSEPVTARVEPVTARSEPVTARSEPVTARSEPVTARVEPPKGFDPLAVILAGRESSCAEEVPLADADEAVEGSGEEFQEFLCFRVSSEIYAINIMEIKEIIKPREVTEVPRAPAFVSGVLSLRGIIIPIFNMRLRLGLADTGHFAKERIIVLKKRDEFFGVLVDEVIQVVRIATATIEKPPAVLDGIDRDFVSGIGRFGRQMLIVLNQEKILDLTLG